MFYLNKEEKMSKTKTGEKVRKLDDDFMKDLLQDRVLHPLKELLVVDKSLDMQIRDNYINIYYRGGSLIKVERKTRLKKYQCKFTQENESGENGYKREIVEFYKALDIQYDPCVNVTDFTHQSDVKDWIAQILPKQKMMMDLHKRCWGERQHQQYIVNSNNYGRESVGTDWFLLDMEYYVRTSDNDSSKSNTKIDLIGFECKNDFTDAKWALIELKTGEKAFEGNSGIEDHLIINWNLANNKSWVETTSISLNNILEQKKRLGLANYVLTKKLSSKTPYIVFILTEIRPGETKIINVLKNIKSKHKEKLPFLRFFVSSLMGFGLYNKMLLDVDALINLLESRDSFQVGKDSKASALGR